MNFNKKNIKIILGIITFTVILIFVINRFGIIAGALKNLFKILIPFIIGAAAAFVINVLLNFFENKCFKKLKKPRLKRGISLALCFIVIAGILTLCNKHSCT